MSLLSECEIWSFHILRSSPCPFQCFTHPVRSLVANSSSLQPVGSRHFFSALVSPAKKITKKTSAPLRLSSLVLLFQGHVACGNCYPDRVLIPTHSPLALQGQVGEITRKRLTISSFQLKKCVIFVHLISDQSLTSNSSLFIPLGIGVAFSGLSSWMRKIYVGWTESKKREWRVHVSSLKLALTAVLFLTIEAYLHQQKSCLLRQIVLSSPTLNKCGWFVSILQIFPQTGNLQKHR